MTLYSIGVKTKTLRGPPYDAKHPTNERNKGLCFPLPFNLSKKSEYKRYRNVYLTCIIMYLVCAMKLMFEIKPMYRLTRVDLF